MRIPLTLAVLLLGLQGARHDVRAEEVPGPTPADLSAALEALLAEPLGLELEVRHGWMPARRDFSRPRGHAHAESLLVEARVVGPRAWAITSEGTLDLTFTRDGVGHLVLERRRPSVVSGRPRQAELHVAAGRRLVAARDGMPDRAALGADLDRLLDPRGLVPWLRAQSDWTVFPPNRLRAVAKPSPGDPSWGAVTRLDVEARFSVRGPLDELVVTVRRDWEPSEPTGPDPTWPARRDLARWEVPFPRAALRSMDAVAGPSLPEGHPDAVDPAHEVTTYALRPSFKPASARLEALMATTEAR
jgi:hypothetical protein